MSNALQNAAKLNGWVDLVGMGADPTGIQAADTFMAQAIATGLPIHVRANATIRLNKPISKSLSIGEDFILTGAGRESSRLLFSESAAGGVQVNYSSNAGGQAQGNKTAIKIGGLDIETERAGGGSAIRITNTPPAGQVNETQVAVDLFDLRTNGANSAAYWDVHQELQNVTFPTFRDIESQDANRRGVALSLNSTGDYSAVEFSVTNYRANAVGTALRVRGRCEGVYLTQFVAVGGDVGVDWVATSLSGGKKPLLLLSASHINVNQVAVKTTDVAQVIGGHSLIYVTNSASSENLGFDFRATGNLSNENSVLSGVTIIGLGARTNSLAKGVRLGSNVSGCMIDARIDNLGYGVVNEGRNNLIGASAKLSNCETRTTGFDDLGFYGGAGSTASVDGSLQLEFIDGDTYAVDQNRGQVRAGSFIFTASASEETITQLLDLPFRNDTAVLLACWGQKTTATAQVYPSLSGSTKDTLHFDTRGTTQGATYRINYIAYGR